MKQLASKIFRYLKLYFFIAKTSVMSVFIYRANSLVFGITPVIWMLTSLVFISVIFGGVKEIGGWSFWEVMLLLGIHELVFLGTWMFFADNLDKLIYDVRTGALDRTLVKPANQRFLVSFGAIDLTGIGSLLNTIVVLSLAIPHVDIKISALRIILFLISLFSAYATVYLLYFSVSCLSLFFVNAYTFSDWLLEATDFDRYPAEIYSRGFRRFLFFGLPILFFAYVPTAILLGKIPNYFVGLGLLVIIGLIIISTILWRKGLKRYQSASS
ncbi:hypothetical protein COS54_00815 [Candidatus Shapirobacteria bacterium CG03_land_8_20_14_0_80_39_12]|uniref:ABC transporter permease n=1 Tax=Candidatus Shapirobacteria bacterium CG03_land_8_20_14_0_80_39_12 TaxID=1974879 RepID=A0A2M7BEJ6_9BACT|nr:MAG: hypothetical protein COS54_00815 [Candidatus Shapirobacteria bacterium CG03_land_8_20_14_0_80_39_12]